MRGSGQISKNVLYDKKSNTGLRIKTKEDDKKQQKEELEKLENLLILNTSRIKQAAERYEKEQRELILLHKKSVYLTIKAELQAELNQQVTLVDLHMDYSDSPAKLNVSNISVKNKSFSFEGSQYEDASDFAIQNDNVRFALDELTYYCTHSIEDAFQLNDSILGDDT